MDKKQKKELTNLAGEDVRFDFPMAQYTTFGTGGPVEALYEARSLKVLRQVIAYLNEEHIPYLVVGRGSNILVKDGGLEGVAILLRGSLAFIEKEKTGLSAADAQAGDLSILTGAGLSIADLLTYCRDSQLGGMEFLAGIPGTIGGAIAMNAGAFEKEIGARVEEIHVITAQGDVVVRAGSQLRFSYRALEIEKGNLITLARLRLTREAEGVVAARIADYLKRRKESQPLEFPSAGSVFKNPPDDYAGRLIENSGLKGERIGGAMISEKHANFIVNTGGARAKDVLALLCMARDIVKRKTGIELEPEIRVVGHSNNEKAIRSK
ncbi:MAG: UDP-N-acetylmuramate dehydrogenase [Deltaproteobacteria bacterium]|nr:UDP-N-acetylmuramate dehydrogenase [Deltaproteobacteria bacterium]MBW2344354.1 UDP-N-acetylmuramate dehydrogenase [Deltaproteobacteria bacterium]